MIYQFTGQPGHGKTLNALLMALQFKDAGRLVYACNVRDLDHEKSGLLPLSPEQFKDWESLPDGSVVLVDECYEHGMLPKRAPGSKLPRHVEQLAKHRHRGFDFIFVTQSPSKQMDEFVHDLIEKHVHVRRRYGLPFVHLRTFDRYERNPEKAHPLTIKRQGLPKRPMGLYKSTELDTTKRGVPWYYFAAVGLVLFVVAGSAYSYHNIRNAFDPNKLPAGQGTAGKDGAPATAAAGVTPFADDQRVRTPEALAEALRPRIPGMHGTEPIFGERKARSEPRTFCVISGTQAESRCTCYTEQATPIADVRHDVCMTAARFGAYDPFLPPFKDAQVSASRGVGAAAPTEAPLESHGIETKPSEVGGQGMDKVW